MRRDHSTVAYVPHRFLRRPSAYDSLIMVVAVVLGAIVIVPAVLMLVRAFTDVDGRVTLEAVRNVVAMPSVSTAIGNTLFVVVVAGIVALVVGTFFAWVSERTDARLGILGDILPLAPLLIPKVAMSIGWVFLAAPQAGFINGFLRWVLGFVGIELSTGPLNIYSRAGLIFLFSLDFIPYVFLIMAIGFRNLDAALDEASRASGAGRWRTFTKVSLPAIRPAIGASAFIVIVAGVSVYSIPTIVGTQAGVDMLSVRIVRLVRGAFPPRTDEAIVLSLVLLAIIGLAWLVQVAFTGRGRYATVGGRGASDSRVQLGRWRWPVRALAALFLSLTAVLPMLALALVSLQSFWSPRIDLSSLSFAAYEAAIVRNRLAASALRNSVLLGVVTATIGVAVATLLLVRARQRGGSSARRLEGLLRLPAGLSPIVVSVSFIAFFAGPPFMLAGTLTILVLAYLVVYLPQGAVSVEAALRQVGKDLEEAAHASGASRARTFFRVQLPLMMMGLAAAWAFLFVYVIGDLTASAMLAGTRTPVVGFVILEIWENALFPRLAALATLVSAITSAIVLTVLAASRSKRRRSPRRRGRAVVGVGAGGTGLAGEERADG